MDTIKETQIPGLSFNQMKKENAAKTGLQKAMWNGWGVSDLLLPFSGEFSISKCECI